MTTVKTTNSSESSTSNDRVPRTELMENHHIGSSEEDGSASSMMEGDDVTLYDSTTNDASRSHNNTDRAHSNSSSSDDEIASKIAKRETTAVFRLRVVVIVLLLITACVVSAVVLSITRSGEMDEFETQFQGAAYAIEAQFASIIEKLSVISTLGVVSEPDDDEDNNNKANPWPFQTLTNFQERAASARYMSGALSIDLCPVVTVEQREQWEEYVNAPESSAWIDEMMNYQEQLNQNGYETNQELIEKSILSNSEPVDPIKYFDSDGQAHVQLDNGPYLPTWQTSPVLQRRLINQDVFAATVDATNQSKLAALAMETQQAILSGFVAAPYGNASHSNPQTSLFATLHSIAQGNATQYLGDPLSYFYVPVFDRHNVATRQVVAVLQSLIHWRSYFRNTLPNGIPPITAVLEASCNGQDPLDHHDGEHQQIYTYSIQGPEAYIVGFGDYHDAHLDQYERHASFASFHLRDGTVSGLEVNPGQDLACRFDVHIYPTQLFMDTYNTDTPLAITFAIAVVFIFTICMFLLYDRLVEQRQSIVMAQAAHTTAIVSSLFPKQVRDRLLATTDLKKDENRGLFMANKSRLKGFLDDGDKSNSENDNNQAPIADLFPECSVFFCDIAGFTAWSSTREPEQVFVLLQTVYQKFDALAKRRKVFKVETIGDSYMACTGLPEPMANHAVTMVRFAWDCRNEFHKVTKDLEVSLGPDTGDLAMRFGIHSGPVTAGVLRGDRARFQLFGDTVNTASRMESTGVRDRVHISTATADLLRKAGKESWIRKREDEVHAKGKGIITTFWATPRSANSMGSSDASGEDGSTPGSNGNSAADGANGAVSSSHQPSYKQVNQRLVDWMTDLLLDHIKKVVYSRSHIKNKATDKNKGPTYFPEEGMTCMDEVKDIIEMPNYNSKLSDINQNYRRVIVPEDVVKNLREYVAAVASGYRENPFHNFEHACHVTMSVNKLLKRIVAPELSNDDLEKLKKVDDIAYHLHDYTHGINSDPLLAFAITISALIHDVDHRGVSNSRLIVEEPDMAAKYREQSVAEQNSLDIAWEMLMHDNFSKVRSYLLPTETELMRFRQLIVNVVLATDIMDKTLNDQRKARWARAFSDEHKEESSHDSNLRATIVIEHLIQASDVSHTMQHWHVYRKWNERLFHEVYKAYLCGRIDADPSESWYKGEIGFFDYYIIPLAKKLKECGVFGVSSDEYLSYAEQNRSEWERKGQEIVQQMLVNAKKQQ